MSFLRSATRAYMLDRLMRGGRRGRRSGYGYGRGYGRGRRSSGGVFPFPHYSTRTRRGSRVTVGGCCLPIPLGVFGVTALAARVLLRS